MARIRPIYLDYAASSPMTLEARKAYLSALGVYGNAGSIHSFGQQAIAVLDAARETAVRALGIDAASRFRELVFTGSATEANNLALRGAVRNFVSENQNNFSPAEKFSSPSARGSSRGSETKPASPAGRSRETKSRTFDEIGIRGKVDAPKIIITGIEHDSVYETAMDLKQQGVEVVVLPVNTAGAVDVNDVKRELDSRTVLVSVMYVNNETGSIQPIKKIADAVRAFRGEKRFPLFHTDAVQAFAYLDCNPDTLGVDLMTLSGHKIGGPKGVGALYVRNISALHPVMTGGGQEFGLRSGTEAVPSIAAFAAALDVTFRRRVREARRVSALTERLWKGIRRAVPKAQRNGGGAPHILSVRFPHHSAADLMVRLDRAGVAVSAGAACSARSPEPSRAILAMHAKDSRAAGETIRFSLGAATSALDISAALRRLNGIFS